MSLATKVVLKGAFAIVRFVTWLASLFKTCSCSSGGSRSFVCQNFLSKYLRSQRWQRRYTTFEIVPVPVRLHVCALEVTGSEGDLAGTAGERMRGTAGRRWRCLTLCEYRHGRITGGTLSNVKFAKVFCRWKKYFIEARMRGLSSKMTHKAHATILNSTANRGPDY